MKKWILFSLLCGLLVQVNAQRDHRLLREGDANYKAERYEAAAENYRQSLSDKNSAQGAYNLGNAQYRQGKYDEAVTHFEEAAELSGEEAARAMAYHNLGNSYFQLEDYEKSVEAYKNALRLRPGDQETKINLAKALRQLPPPQQQQDPQPSDEENEDNPEENEEQPPQESQEDQDSQQEQQDQQPQESEAPPQENQQPQPQEGDISREEAERLLRIAEDEEQQTMERLRKEQSQGCKSEKDW